MPFKHGLFGCFDNIGLCVITFFVPCYTFGKNAEAVGESCILCGLIYMIPPVDFIMQVIIRGRIRAQGNLESDLINDILSVWCCPCCALVQEAQEVRSPAGAYMQRS